MLLIKLEQHVEQAVFSRSRDQALLQIGALVVNFDRMSNFHRRDYEGGLCSAFATISRVLARRRAAT